VIDWTAPALSAGQTFTIDGYTITAFGNVTAQQVADAILNGSADSGSKMTISGSGHSADWTVTAGSGSGALVFTSTTNGPSTHLSDLNVSGSYAGSGSHVGPASAPSEVVTPGAPYVAPVSGSYATETLPSVPIPFPPPRRRPRRSQTARRSFRAFPALTPMKASRSTRCPRRRRTM